jgi:hypothetical protein
MARLDVPVPVEQMTAKGVQVNACEHVGGWNNPALHDDSGHCA